MLTYFARVKADQRKAEAVQRHHMGFQADPIAAHSYSHMQKGAAARAQHNQYGGYSHGLMARTNYAASMGGMGEPAERRQDSEAFARTHQGIAGRVPARLNFASRAELSFSGAGHNQECLPQMEGAAGNKIIDLE